MDTILIEAHAPDFWKDLLTSVEQLLEKLGLPSAALQKIPSTRFIVHQPRYPAVDVIVDLDIPARTIRYKTVCRASRDVSPSSSERRLSFHLNDGGELYLKQGAMILNVDAAANLLLQPFLNQTSP